MICILITLFFVNKSQMVEETVSLIQFIFLFVVGKLDLKEIKWNNIIA